MTDKQIIIDGIDVSGCVFYGFSNLNNHLCTSKEFSKIDCTYCNNNPNCYYKQLKRAENTVEECHKYQAELEDKLTAKEQECERLKNERTIDLVKQLDQLKAENDELKTKLINWLGKEGLRQSEKEFYEQQLEAYKMEAEEGKEINAELKSDNKYLNDLLNQALKDYEKAVQTLTEIKEIAEVCQCHNVDGCYECKHFDYCDIEDAEIPTRDVCKLILQKISEVEE